jgi:uncharacterized membrane protein YedE/YeeE
MEHFTPYASLAGGVLIGLSATAMLVLLGRVAGISGILGTALGMPTGEGAWRLAFIAGLLTGGVVMARLMPAAFTMTLDRSTPALVLAGLLVGFGSRLGSGCTSGHGVCGMARGSRRSIAATLTFMTTAALTVLVVNRLFGGAL